MNRTVLGILLLAAMAPGQARAQSQDPSEDAAFDRSDAQRYSPHFYTVRNIFRNHRKLTPAGAGLGNGLIGGRSIPIASVELESDVAFQDGVYEFHARIQDAVSKARLRRREGHWFLELIDDFNGAVLATYVLEH
jgi:hypothetical protein